MKKSFFALLLLLPIVGCDRSPIGPSQPSSPTDISAWMPCTGIHIPGGRGWKEFETQTDAIRRMQNAGNLKWVRLGYVDPRESGHRDYVTEFSGMGLKIFTNISLQQLNSGRSWEDVFDRFHNHFPEVDIWEIAGEITNSDPSVNIMPTTPEIYMGKFRQLYNHVKKNYPHVALASAPTLGSVGGPHELHTFFELGLLDMDVIITLNLYTENALQQYAALFDNYASKMWNKRVWIPETGTQPQSKHIWWIQNMYPKIKRTLRPEMVCWYILWDGDTPPGQTNGLLNNLYSPPVQESPLLKLLTGAGR